MRKRNKFVVWILTAVLLGSTFLTACGSGSMGKMVVKVDNTKIGMNEMMYYIYQTEEEGNYYEELYSTYFDDSYWDMEYEEGYTFREFFKEETMSNAIRYTIFEEKAKKAGYSLSAEEKTEIAGQAQSFYEALSETQRTTMGLDVKEIAAIGEKIALSEKYHEEIMSGIQVDIELAEQRIDPDEHRQYDVEYIYVPTVKYDEEFNPTELSEEAKEDAYELILDILEKAKESEDFTDLIPEESLDMEAGIISFMEGDELFGAEFEKEALKLSNGQVSEQIVEEEDGYYIVKMLNDNSTESYDDEVAAMQERLVYEEFQKIFEQMKAEYKIEINKSIWDEIVIGNTIYESHSN